MAAGSAKLCFIQAATPTLPKSTSLFANIFATFEYVTGAISLASQSTFATTTVKNNTCISSIRQLRWTIIACQKLPMEVERLNFGGQQEPFPFMKRTFHECFEVAHVCLCFYAEVMNCDK